MIPTKRHQRTGDSEQPIFGLATLLFVGHRALRLCSLLTPRGQPKSLVAPSASIYEMTSSKFPKKFLCAIIFSGWIGLAALATAADAGSPVITNAAGVSPADPKLADAAAITNQDALRSMLEVQDQIHELQAANERNAKLMEERMKSIESSIAGEQTRQLAEVQRTMKEVQQTNKAMLWQAMAFAAVGFLVLILAVVIHWLTVNRFAKMLALAPVGLALGEGKVPAALGMGNGGAVAMLPSPVVEQSTERFLEILSRLEKRILEFEASAESHGALPENGGGKAQLSTPAGGGSESADSVMLLLSKGQTLLKLDQPEEALACFDEVLALEPGQVEALLKKGAALERLQRRLDGAINCYDRAAPRHGSLPRAGDGVSLPGGVYFHEIVRSAIPRRWNVTSRRCAHKKRVAPPT